MAADSEPALPWRSLLRHAACSPYGSYGAGGASTLPACPPYRREGGQGGASTLPAFPPVWRARSDASAPSPIRCACRSLPCAGRCASAPMRRSSAVRTACAPSAPSLARFTSGVGCHARRTCTTRRAPPRAATPRKDANPFTRACACAVRGGTPAAVSLAHAAWLRQCQSAHRRSCVRCGRRYDRGFSQPPCKS